MQGIGAISYFSGCTFGALTCELPYFKKTKLKKKKSDFFEE
jgi:hypothetical protein